MYGLVDSYIVTMFVLFCVDSLIDTSLFSVGHCHPAVTKAACRQMSQLYTNCRYLNDNLSTYVYRLVELFPSPLDTCFLTNSG